jgi:hypothetical protein
VFFESDEIYTGPPITDAMIRAAETTLGYTLPADYVRLLFERNGGRPIRRRLATAFPTSWADDHIEIASIKGVGGMWGIDSESGLGSAAMIAEWDYPSIGIVLCDMPSGGHDAVMLDYTDRNYRAQPCVAYVDEDRVAREIAPTFTDFISRLY